MKNKGTAAVIAAAGQSTRMGGQNKMLASIGGIPVIVRSLSAFCKAELIGSIVIVTGENDVDAVKELCAGFTNLKPVAVVAGGATRAESVLKGINALSEICDYDYIAVHDGARPLVKPELIDRVVAVAYKSGAAIPAVRVKDTIKKVTDGRVAGTPLRDELYAAQTPQVFRLSLYLNAVQNLSDITDDSSLLEKIGAEVRITEGDYTNIKITTPDDLIAARAFSEAFNVQDRSRL